MHTNGRGGKSEKKKKKGWGGSNEYIYSVLLQIVPQGGWAAPRSTAILGQPVGRAKQASIHVPRYKN